MLIFDIITPSGSIFSKEVNEINISTRLGELTILKGHIPLISEVVPGTIKVICKGEKHNFKTSNGFLKLSQNKVNLIVDEAEILNL